MGLIGRHSGKIGDIIYALPTIRELGIDTLYIPENTPDGCTGMYSGLKDLLLLQPYIREVREYPSGLNYRERAPGIDIDYDLDDARLQPMKGVIHIVKRYMDAFGVDYPGWKEPWLQLPDNPIQVIGGYAVINYTGRHIHNDKLNITSNVDWGKILKSIDIPVVFVGTFQELERFEKIAGPVEYVNTKNMLDVAYVLKGAKAVYCNQSACLALSQSMGKPYYLDVKPQKTNCLLYTNNENILL
jgi:hypothetical protein